MEARATNSVIEMIAIRRRQGNRLLDGGQAGFDAGVSGMTVSGIALPSGVLGGRLGSVIPHLPWLRALGSLQPETDPEFRLALDPADS